MIAGLGVAVCVKAQEIKEASFADFFEVMPQPKATISETVAIYDNYQVFDKEMQGIFRQIKDNLDFIYQSWFENFKTNLEKSKQDKAFLSRLSPEEKSLLESFGRAVAGLSSRGQFISFHLIIPDRPLIGSGKTSWGKTNGLSPAVQTLHQQVVQIEKELNWTALRQLMQGRKEGIGSYRNEELDALNDKLQAGLKKLPHKKVKIFEGATIDVEDPLKAIALLEQNEAARQKFFQAQYAPELQLWNNNFTLIKTAGEKLDGVLVKINYGNGLGGNDKQLIPVVADVQARIWEMTFHLTNITRDVINDAQIAEASKASLKQNMDIYKKYQESIEQDKPLK